MKLPLGPRLERCRLRASFGFICGILRRRLRLRLITSSYASFGSPVGWSYLGDRQQC